MRVPSRTPREAPYLVELNAYGCNGTCQCKHFATRLEPLLRRGVTPIQAFEQGLAKIPEWSTFADDSLRCWHIHAARLKFADDTIHAIHDAQKKHATAPQDPNTDEPEPF